MTSYQSSRPYPRPLMLAGILRHWQKYIEASVGDECLVNGQSYVLTWIIHLDTRRVSVIDQVF